MKHVGNVEPYLSYGKLHRTGRLLRGLRVKRSVVRGGVAVTLYNNVRYAEDHELGKTTRKMTIRSPYVTNGATGVVTGGNIVARPFMKPSSQVLRSPIRLTESKIRSLGWQKT